MLPMAVVIAIVMLIITHFIVRYTALGLFIESIGANVRSSAYAGIGTKVVTIAVYMWCGLCAAIAGLIVTADIRGADANNAGLWLELDAILAVVIGGTSLFGGRFSLGALGRRRADHPGDEHRHPAERLPAGIQPYREGRSWCSPCSSPNRLFSSAVRSVWRAKA